MKFEHLLARDAKVWHTRLEDGAPRAVLVIITTLELDPKAKRFKSDLVGQLEDAARAFLLDNPNTATGAMVMNRPKDW